MIVGRSGRLIGGVTIGGCVDAQVIEAADALVVDGEADALLVDLARRRRGMGDRAHLRRHARRAARARATPSIARPIRRSSRIGAAIELLDGVGESRGDRHAARRRETLGDRIDRWPASRAFATERVETVAVDACFFDRVAPPMTLVIVGAGQIAMSLTRLARELDMRTIVVDGRERYATRERFPDADEIRVGMPSEIVASIAPTKRVAVVLVAHDYKYELPVLRHVLRAPVGYIGMLGSRKRGAAVRDLLRDEGFTDDELARIHTPIGLDLGGKTSGGGRAVDPRRDRRGAQREAGVTGRAYRARSVLEHFRHPRNRGPLDRRRRVGGGRESALRRPHPDAAAGRRRRDRRRAIHRRRVRAVHRVGVAAHRARARTCAFDAASRVDERWLFTSLDGEPPPARRKCAMLPLDTLHRAVGAFMAAASMIVGLLLAAGGATRFGSQKLVAPRRRRADRRAMRRAL